MGDRIEVDLAVVGGGIVGLSTALAAADDGLEVVCFEAGRPGAGQSAGRTRIFRHRHSDPELTALALRARAAWERWEQRFGCELVGGEGVVMTGPDLDGDFERLAEAGVEVRALDHYDQRRALPVAAPLGETVLLDVRGGAIRADRAVAALAGALGHRLVAAEVVGLHPGRDDVTVATSEGVWLARRAVVCAGVDTARIARGIGLELPIETGCQLRATYAVGEAVAGARLACLLDRRGPDASSYAAPSAPARSSFGACARPWRRRPRHAWPSSRRRSTWRACCRGSTRSQWTSASAGRPSWRRTRTRSRPGSRAR